MSKHVGFTGTQRGTTARQRLGIQRLLIDLEVTDFHHGDCVGGDRQAHLIAETHGSVIYIHPPLNPSKRAFCKADIMAEPKPYLERNRDIVNASDVLIGAPGETQEQLRSGTWSTIRYAKRANKPVYIVFPDGAIRWP